MHKSVKDILDKKRNGVKISVITAYDYTLATLCDKADVDILLVGDSAGMVMLGYENTIPVTMEQMIIFTEAVSRARQSSLIVADMPFMSYQASISDAITNSGKLIRAGADAVKLEGGKIIAPTIKAIIDAGIPVMGHIGFQPQTTTLSQGYRVQARTSDAAKNLIEDAKAIEEAGAFSIVLEMVTSEVTKIISESVSIPTIGIGAGKHSDGQVLVVHDILGLYDKLKPRFVRQYLSLSDPITKAIKKYKQDVETGRFPAKDNWFSMDRAEYEKLRSEIEG
ncbi:MAG TPA: 3-methyl-2-oxobutanoate hydroxymethyltransferase [Candidatus Nitrosotenuis sp.]|nr:3-methyl-2-oxobutanoate hydroxymethyltransferase [Candidatus Nitrosotenuis sp.]